VSLTRSTTIAALFHHQREYWPAVITYPSETDLHVGRDALGEDILIFDRDARKGVPDRRIHELVRGDDEVADLVEGCTRLPFDDRVVDYIAQTGKHLSAFSSLGIVRKKWGGRIQQIVVLDIGMFIICVRNSLREKRIA
jgi:hypothetical protein